MDESRWSAWKEKPVRPDDSLKISRMVMAMTRQHMVGDRNAPDYIFVLNGQKNTIPYGRAHAFLNFFEKDLYSDPEMEVFYFSALPSRDRKELREYGILVTTDGLYLSSQLEQAVDKVYPAHNLMIPFASLVDVCLFDDMLMLHILTEEGEEPEEHRLFAEDSTVPLSSLCALCRAVMSSELPRLLSDRPRRARLPEKEEDQAGENKAIAVQCRYCRTAEESVAAAFEEGKARYVSEGVMIPVEVPLDQYQLALEAMQRRIDAGEVPGAGAGDDASRFVCKGAFTYRQTLALARAGTLESLAVTTDNGVVASTSACGITGVILFATCLWNGRSPREAAEITFISSVRSLGQSTLMYTLSRQLSQSRLTNIFQPQFTPESMGIAFDGVQNPVASMGSHFAARVNQSSLAHTALGEAMGLPSITGKALISGTVVGLVVFGPDVVRALRGRISKLQLLKNSLVGASSMIGAALGQMWIPIPVAGAILGAALLGLGIRQALNLVIDDDRIAMFQIFKEEFIDLSMQPGLTRKDFDKLADSTLCSPKIGPILIGMYASDNPRAYAREVIENAASALLRQKRRVDEKEVATAFNLWEETIRPEPGEPELPPFRSLAELP